MSSTLELPVVDAAQMGRSSGRLGECLAGPTLLVCLLTAAVV